MRLDRFDNAGFDRGRPWLVEALWRVVDGLLFRSWLPGSGWRAGLLRLFGAQVGPGAVIKPRVRVTFPWKLRMGAHCWLGEQAWIDNLAEVRIGDHCCISQGAYLCTGNHRWDRETFDLVADPIVLEDHCWIGAMARVGPGVVCREGAVLTLGSVAAADLAAWHVHSGAPARSVSARVLADVDRG
jgi:putative colanic acid biosynthesis acetyltransferase WcaF